MTIRAGVNFKIKRREFDSMPEHQKVFETTEDKDKVLASKKKESTKVALLCVSLHSNFHKLVLLENYFLN